MPKRMPKRRAQKRPPSYHSLPSSPPERQMIPTIRTVMRFQNHTTNNGVSLAPITFNNILNASGILASAANTGYPIHGFFRILRVQMWTCVNAQTSFNQNPSVGIKWFNTVSGNFGDTNEMRLASTISSAIPAYLNTVPPIYDLSSWSQGPSSTQIFTIYTANTTSVILDLHLDLKIDVNDNGSVQSVTTGNTMTAGNMYFPALDGIAGNLWQRVGLPNIV